MAPRPIKLSIMRSTTGTRGRGRGGDCSICLETIADTALTWTHSTCEQSFHQRCYSKWRESLTNGYKPSTCPLCRECIQRHLSPRKPRKNLTPLGVTLPDRVSRRLASAHQSAPIGTGSSPAHGAADISMTDVSSNTASTGTLCPFGHLAEDQVSTSTTDTEDVDTTSSDTSTATDTSMTDAPRNVAGIRNRPQFLITAAVDADAEDNDITNLAAGTALDIRLTNAPQNVASIWDPSRFGPPLTDDEVSAWIADNVDTDVRDTNARESDTEDSDAEDSESEDSESEDSDSESTDAEDPNTTNPDTGTTTDITMTDAPRNVPSNRYPSTWYRPHLAPPLTGGRPSASLTNIMDRNYAHDDIIPGDLSNIHMPRSYYPRGLYAPDMEDDDHDDHHHHHRATAIADDIIPGDLSHLRIPRRTRLCRLPRDRARASTANANAGNRNAANFNASADAGSEGGSMLSWLRSWL